MSKSDGPKFRKCEPFNHLIDSLYELERNNDRATLAKLRRGVGKRLGDEPQRDGWVIRHLRDDTRRRELDRAALLASLFAMHPLPGGSGNLGAALRRGKRDNDDTAIEKRLVILLNSDADDLPHRLRQVTSLLKSREVPVDWRQLLKDLRNWNHPDRFVQVKWSREFWSERSRAEPTEYESAEAISDG